MQMILRWFAAAGRQGRPELGRSRPWRATSAVVLLMVLLMGALGAGRGPTCPRRALAAAQADAPHAATPWVAVHDHAQSAPDADPAVPVPSCGTGVAALPEPSVVAGLAASADVAPVVRAATFVASHDPPPPFRPPRVI